ncbi:MAG: YIP1 family protein [Chloroflexi bacterium]|nr:YIP1 family protein [Chloroflexota bacterium]
MYHAIAGPDSVLGKMLRAAKLEIGLYDEVRHESASTSEAFQAIVIIAISAGLGRAIGSLDRGIGVAGATLAVAVVAALISWVVMSVATYFVATAILGGKASPGALLRVLAFAEAPTVLNLLRFVPILGTVVVSLTFGWTLITLIVALRQALDVGTGRAIATAVLAFIPTLVVGTIVAFPLVLLRG